MAEGRPPCDANNAQRVAANLPTFGQVAMNADVAGEEPVGRNLVV